MNSFATCIAVPIITVATTIFLRVLCFAIDILLSLSNDCVISILHFGFKINLFFRNININVSRETF